MPSVTAALVPGKRPGAVFGRSDEARKVKAQGSRLRVRR